MQEDDLISRFRGLEDLMRKARTIPELEGVRQAYRQDTELAIYEPALERFYEERKSVILQQ